MSITVVQKQAQDNVETPGAKCNRCFYDIIWDKENAIKAFGKNRPYQPDHQTPHSCEMDAQNNIVTRPGYGLIDGKVRFLLSKTPSSLPPGQQTIRNLGPNGVDIYSIEAMVKEQIGQISQHYLSFQEEYKKMVSEQSIRITEIKNMIYQYIEHNPTEGAMRMIISEMIKYLPEPVLTKPTMASDLREESSGYTRGENQN
jgi:hypothetical protein